MATLGPNDLKQYALPAGWDGGRLTQIRLESGETYEQLLTDITSALAIQNAALLTDPLVGGLVSTTTEAAVEIRTGVSNGFEDHTEYGTPDAKRAASTGHMLPLLSYDRKLGWSWDFLRRARRFQIDNDIASSMADLRDLWQRRVLTRLFKSTYDAVGSGKSVPVADGGVADATYIPVNQPERSAAFNATHSHLQRLNGITQTNLETAVAHVWHHGYDAPYELLIAQADIAAWQAVTGFVKKPDVQIQYGSNTTVATVSDDYIGVITTAYGSCRLRANARIPSTFWTVYKSFGTNDTRNVLRVRTPIAGLGALLLAGDHVRQFPFENSILFFEFGVGLGEDRASAVLVRNDTTGNYTDPVIG